MGRYRWPPGALIRLRVEEERMATAARTARVARPAPVPKEKETAEARRTTNTWWCPWDDRAMQHKDPCDVCGATFDGRSAKRHS